MNDYDCKCEDPRCRDSGFGPQVTDLATEVVEEIHALGYRIVYAEDDGSHGSELEVEDAAVVHDLIAQACWAAAGDEETRLLVDARAAREKSKDASRG